MVLSQLLTFAILALVGFFFEELLRARRPVPADAHGQSVRLNLGVAVLYFVAEALFAIGGRLALVAFVAKLPGAGLLSEWWLFNASSAAAVIGAACVYIAVEDFFDYWLHRAQHRWSWLWAIHELHHSDEHMNVTTAFRHHWLTVPLRILIIAPMAYLATPTPAVATIVGVFLLVMNHVIHLNARIRFGGWAIVTPQYHRIHHSSEARHLDRNFANMCPLWDVVFGTYYKAAKHEYPTTGLIQGGSPRTMIDAAALPFQRWRRMKSSGESATV